MEIQKQEFDGFISNIKIVTAIKYGHEIGKITVDTDTCELKTIEILRDHRNIGLGNKLLKEAEKILLENGCSKCHVDLGRPHFFAPNSSDFFKKNGYTQCHTFLRFISYRHSLLMEKDLAS